MYNTVIALQGKSQIGKTETLKRFINLLCNDGWNMINLSKRSTVDRTVIMKKIVNKAEYKVFVTTLGDYRSVLESAFNKCKEQCDLYICACHLSGSTHEYLEEHSKTVYYWNCFYSGLEKSEARFNQKRAQELYKYMKFTLFDE